MKTKSLILFLILLLSNTLSAYTYTIQRDSLGKYNLPAQITGTDTTLLVFLHDVYIFPKLKFKNKAQEKFYWRTVRDVKKTLPYAKLIAEEMATTDKTLIQLSTKKEQREYMKNYEKQLFKRYEPAFRKMTARQGQMLMKLVDRECDRTSYEVIKYYKGSITAFFWQGIARLFGNNLKSEYDAADKDKITERIILLVEAGQL